MKRKIQRGVVALEGQTVEIAQSSQVYVDRIIIHQSDQEELKRAVINQSFQIRKRVCHWLWGDHEKPVQQEKDWAPRTWWINMRNRKGKVEAVVFPFDQGFTEDWIK